ncbi:MAG: hypothetical protein IPM47_18230 [Sphingobacteriales bacterium]|nr:MAG: hypothetical protein IPM47_18230 [Sphingobacteriales bacterium]
MKKKDNLFRLIKSLSKSEKRFFKIYSSRHVIGEQNNYVELFDAIDNQLVYNEEALLKKFAGKKFANRLPVAKSYLYELILRSMNVYHAQNSVDAQLREMMGTIAFLYHKGMFDQALKMVIKAKKLSAEVEKKDITLQIINWEKLLIEADSFNNQSDTILAQLQLDSQNLLNQLIEINQYWLLHAHLQYYQTKHGITGNREDLDQIARLLNNPLLQDEIQPSSFEAKLLRFKTLANCNFIIRNLPSCYEYSKKLVSLLEERPELLQFEPVTYINAINNLLNTTAALNKQPEREFYLLKLQAMLLDENRQSEASIQLKLFEAYYYHRMTLYISQGDYYGGLSCINDLEEGLIRFSEQIDGMGVVMLCFYAFHLCFGAEQFERAHSWLQRVLEYQHTNIRKDVVGFAKILTLLTAYELDDHLQRKQTIISVYRFLLKKEMQYKLENIILQLLRKLSHSTSETDFAGYLSEMQVVLDQLAEDNFERRVFAYFDFRAWVAAKTEAKSLANPNEY